MTEYTKFVINMKVSIDRRIEKFLNRLSLPERAKISKLKGLFAEKGFLLSEKHLKKINKRIWELRPGNVRILLSVIGQDAIFLNAFLKKTNKTPLFEIKTAENRLGEYL